MRLRQPRDFQHVWSEGRSWAHSLFVLWAVPSTGAGVTRWGLVASRKVGNAVARNRARRLLREAVRQLQGHVPGGWDIILLARRHILQVKEPRVAAALEKILQRAGLWS
ncbi:MAG: ribonuclease P protein component [Chloroflexota bacterium]|nr:ribonuclease P protein component [Chloroflexota bacterium]